MEKLSKKMIASPPASRRLTQQRTLDTRRKIIEVAIVEFAKNGYEGTSTRTVAAVAGLPHTLVTYHFQGKEGLWREAISSMLQEYAAAYDARLRGLRDVDDTTKLRRIYEDFIRFSAEHLNFHWIMAHAARTHSQQLEWLVNEFLRRRFDSRATLIRAVQKAGHFIQGDPYHLEYVFIGAVTRMFMLSSEVEMIAGTSPFDKLFIEEHIRICLGLFFRDPPAKGRRRSAVPKKESATFLKKK